MRTGRGGRLVALTAALSVGLLIGGGVGFLAQGQPSPPIPGPSVGSAALPAAEPLAPATLLAWTPGGLPPALAAGVAALPGVRHVVAVTSGVAWMTRSSSPEGTVIDRPSGGFQIPLEVGGADLRAYAPFLSPADRTLLPALARGEVVLGATSAKLRRLGPGGTLRFGSKTVRVAGVVPDAAIGAQEVFASSETAARLGVTTPRYLLIDPAPGASRERLTARIRALLPPGKLLQVRGPGETPFFRQGDAVLPPVELKVMLGEFAARPLPNGYLVMDPAWEAAHIVTASVPILGQVRCNRAIIPQVRGALSELVRDGLSQLIDPTAYAGCYSARFLNRDPTASISHHSWGAALDINLSTNHFGQVPHQDPRLVAVFERWGFTWGGRWLVPDGMHFEFVRFVPGG